MKNLTWVFLLAAVLCAKLSFAQDPQWHQTNGPGGVELSALAIDSSGVLYAGTPMYSRSGGRIFRSSDKGLTWTNVHPDTLHSGILQLEVAKSGTVFVRLTSSLMRSADGGKTWTEFPNSFASFVVHGDSLFGINANSIYVSADEGETWSRTEIRNLTGPLIQLAVSREGVLFVTCLDHSTNQGNLFRSTDAGANWSMVVNGVADVQTFLISEDGQQVLHLCSVGYSRASNYLSTDQGRTWAPSSDPGVGPVVANHFNSRIAINQTGIRFDPANIAKATVPFINNSTLPVYVCGVTDEFFIGVEEGMLGRVDPKSLTIDNHLIPTGSPYLLRSSKDSIIAEAFQNDEYTKQWSIISGDSGWSTNITGADILLAAKDSSGNEIYCSFYEDITHAISDNQYGKFSSEVTSLNFSTKGSVIVSTSSEGIFRSTDDGSTWDQSILGLSDLHVKQVVATAGPILAFTPSGVFTSANDGLNWSIIPSSISVQGSAVAVIGNKGEIVVGDSASDVFMSKDNGQTWKQWTLPDAGSIQALLSTPGGTIFLGSARGVYSLPLGASTWSLATSGIASQRVLSLAIDKQGFVYVGVEGSGVYRSAESYNVSGASGVSRTSLLASQLEIDALYPNPVSRQGSLTFSIPQASDIRIEITNALGESVREIAAGHFEKGQYDATLTTTGLVNGAYLLRLTSAVGTATQKLVIAN